jgi:hypothetical protein
MLGLQHMSIGAGKPIPSFPHCRELIAMCKGVDAFVGPLAHRLIGHGEVKKSVISSHNWGLSIPRVLNQSRMKAYSVVRFSLDAPGGRVMVAWRRGWLWVGYGGLGGVGGGNLRRWGGRSCFGLGARSLTGGCRVLVYHLPSCLCSDFQKLGKGDVSC